MYPSYRYGSTGTHTVPVYHVLLQCLAVERLGKEIEHLQLIKAAEEHKLRELLTTKKDKQDEIR
jgi:hypothetical protein